MKGWYNDKYRHSLAAMGVKTALARKRMTYPQLRTVKGSWGSPQMREAILAERRVVVQPKMMDDPEYSVWGLKGIPGVREQLEAEELEPRRKYMRRYLEDYQTPEEREREELEIAMNLREAELEVPESAPIGRYEPYKTLLESEEIEHLGMAGKRWPR